MDKQPECYNDSVDLINKISENAHDMSNIMNVAKGIVYSLFLLYMYMYMLPQRLLLGQLLQLFLHLKKCHN